MFADVFDKGQAALLQLSRQGVETGDVGVVIATLAERIAGGDKRTALNLVRAVQRSLFFGLFSREMCFNHAVADGAELTIENTRGAPSSEFRRNPSMFRLTQLNRTEDYRSWDL